MDVGYCENKGYANQRLKTFLVVKKVMEEPVINRRQAIGRVVATGIVAVASCTRQPPAAEPLTPTVQPVGVDKTTQLESTISTTEKPVGADAVLKTVPLGFQWEVADPFLFCVHHDDAYPAGNERLGPVGSLEGRNLGMDFDVKDGWRMYHGHVVPGFPSHPHRGFETVTIVRRGLVDHSDSLGAAARYGMGDVQWLTAGKGIQHAEMFPLLRGDADNPLELFQIWLNLPRDDKFAEPHFSMFWDNRIPRLTVHDDKGRTTLVTVIAGNIGSTAALAPPPKSWAARPDSDVAIWTIKMEPNARWILPAASPDCHRRLYFFQGEQLFIGGSPVAGETGITLRSDVAVTLDAGASTVEALMLQGRPIREPVARHGPFVMNTQEEIRAAYHDYRATRFGGWPWKTDDPVHPREEGRFARFQDGRIERAG